MEFQSGQCHFGSSPRHFLGRTQRELPANTPVVHKCMQEGDQEKGIAHVLPGSPSKTPCVESLVAYCVKDTIDSISEEVLGIDPEATRSESCCESASRPCQTSLGQRSRQIATAIERLRTKVVVGKLLCTVHYGRIKRSTPNIWDET